MSYEDAWNALTEVFLHKEVSKKSSLLRDKMKRALFDTGTVSDEMAVVNIIGMDDEEYATLFLAGIEYLRAVINQIMSHQNEPFYEVRVMDDLPHLSKVCRSSYLFKQMKRYAVPSILCTTKFIDNTVGFVVLSKHDMMNLICQYTL